MGSSSSPSCFRLREDGFIALGWRISASIHLAREFPEYFLFSPVNGRLYEAVSGSSLHL